MFDDTQNTDQTEQVAQEEVQPAEQPPVENLHQQTQVSPENDHIKNLRILRERSQRAERERDELMRRLAEVEAKTKPQVEDEDFRIGDDEIAEGKHLSKITKKMKKLEEQIANYQQQTNVSTTEARLKAQYPDFERVVNKENIELLRESYPDVAATLNSSTDLYNTASSAYTLIKKLGIAQEDQYAQDRARAQTNAAKPRPLTSISPQGSDSPLSRANAFAGPLTDDLKKTLHREMIEAMKNR
jgi:hypothetical protein